jgi:glycosyltransferase involved in cell wall biosynthesis
MKKENKLLIITNFFDKKNRYGGRQSIALRNIILLKKVFNNKVLIIKLKKRNFYYFYKLFKGYIDGIDNFVLQNLIKKLKKNKIKKIFVDGSNLGEIVRFVKKEIPEIKIYTFFHNVESIFFFSLFKNKMNIHSFGVFLANYLAERKSVKFSDKIILLSKRDSKNLHDIYGRYADCICPLSVDDKLKYNQKIQINYFKDPYILFVGTAFYANIKGIIWFIKNVVPNINIKTYIVGKGFDVFKKKLEVNKRIKVFGFVKNIKQLYLNASLVIAPIFHGSGMKMKVAEAMMFGKKIIGTREAFSGYNSLPKNFAIIASDASSFSNSINKNVRNDKIKFHSTIRKFYQKNYSNKLIEKIFEKNIL